jgi:hypothetical protein
MSQGEVNALALSVFLPRARLPASPFRFLVIDDPVQAMDPAKVDGLARLLEKTAADRQVIVFTHDSRLAEAIRQLRLPAALEVSRGPGSVVDVRPCLDPVTQALADVGALAADRSVPHDVAARVVPRAVPDRGGGRVHRGDLAAAASRRARPRRDRSCIGGGGARLNLLAALALTGNASLGGEVLRRLNAWGRAFGDTYQALNKGSHVAHAGDLGLLVRDARALASKIRDGMP